MVSDSIPMSVSNSKDFAKKKRANRSAKLKQCKLDARREQWLSQVKNKGGKEESNGGGNPTHAYNEIKRSIKALEINPRSDENDGSMDHYSDSGSPSNSPTSHNGSLLSPNESGTNYSGSVGCSGSSSSSSGESCSGSMTEEDEERDDGCLDDWEAVADALADQEQHNSIPESPPKQQNVAKKDCKREFRDGSRSGTDIPNLKAESLRMVQKVPLNCRAWMPDDAFRPQSLPNLSKQLSFPMNSERHYGREGGAWICKNVMSAQSSCPICYEDLDVTDANFLPCLCGFRLCLFCHKRILEDDGRCPGCRKQYEYDPVEGEATLDGGSLTFRLTRSCSMISRC